jgi:hypothetical protein
MKTASPGSTTASHPFAFAYLGNFCKSGAAASTCEVLFINPVSAYLKKKTGEFPNNNGESHTSNHFQKKDAAAKLWNQQSERKCCVADLCEAEKLFQQVQARH